MQAHRVKVIYFVQRWLKSFKIVMKFEPLPFQHCIKISKTIRRNYCQANYTELICNLMCHKLLENIANKYKFIIISGLIYHKTINR